MLSSRDSHHLCLHQVELVQCPAFPYCKISTWIVTADMPCFGSLSWISNIIPTLKLEREINTASSRTILRVESETHLKWSQALRRGIQKQVWTTPPCSPALKGRDAFVKPSHSLLRLPGTSLWPAAVFSTQLWCCHHFTESKTNGAFLLFKCRRKHKGIVKTSLQEIWVPV